MSIRIILISLFLFFLTPSFSQNPTIISGPFQGNTTTSSTEIWLMVKDVETIQLDFEGEANVSFSNFYINDSLLISKGKLDDIVLENNEFIKIKLSIANKELIDSFKLKLPSKEITDFSFLAGSCTWPHKPKNRRWKIFDSMRNFPSDFMMWMGDNIYLITGDWKTKEGIYNRYIKYRQHPKLNAFLKSQPNFAAWDDHEFGPNDADSSFDKKDVTLQAFKDFWINPSYGLANYPGTFYSYKWQDAEFFVLDGRYYKTGEEMYGEVQLEWLKKGILDSDARVKFVVGGSQFLVESSGENWGDHPIEKKDFMDFLKSEKIKGLVFLSGDRHYAELSILNDGEYPKLLEITTSPLSSFPNPFSSNKIGLREKGTLVKKSNFARIFLEGKNENRKLRIELRGKKGQLFWEYEILVDELK